MRARADGRTAAVGKGPNDNQGCSHPAASARVTCSIVRGGMRAAEGRTMLIRKWILQVEISATLDVASRVNLDAIIGEGSGAEPLRALAVEIERWAPSELDARTKMSRGQG